MLSKSIFSRSVCICVHIYSFSISKHITFHRVIMEEVPCCRFKKRFLSLQIQMCKEES